MGRPEPPQTPTKLHLRQTMNLGCEALPSGAALSPLGGTDGANVLSRLHRGRGDCLALVNIAFPQGGLRLTLYCAISKLPRYRL